MHITLESDYAIRIVQYLAAHRATRPSAREMADATGVPASFALKILRKLVAAELAVSYKGVGGGYALAHTPDQVTLRQVIEAVEGPYRFSRCLGDTYDCAAGDAPCRFYAVFDEISRQVSERLEAETFQ